MAGDSRDLHGEVARLDAEIDAHPGTLAREHFEELRRAWDVFDNAARNLYALLVGPNEDPDLITEIMHWKGKRGRAYQQALDSAVQASVAGSSALIEVVRRIVRGQSDQFQLDFAARKAAMLSAGPEAGFWKGFRNYLLHRGHAPWQISTPFTATTIDLKVHLHASQLLLWDGWNTATRAWLVNQETVEVAPVLFSYRAGMYDLHFWLMEHLLVVHTAEIDASNDLIRRRNLLLTGGHYDDQASFMGAVERSLSDGTA